MLTYVKGLLTHSNPQCVVIETHGLGYKIYIPTHLFSTLPALGSEMKLHTSFIIREHSQTLYGFTSEHERDFFEKLMDVSGIGPKLALSLIGHLPLPELAKAIADNQLAKLCKVPGIGKKTAERLVVELRSKVQHMTPYTTTDSAPGTLPEDPHTQIIHDAMSALINLGYTQIIAQKAIKKSLQDNDPNLSLAELITTALKNV